MYSFCIEWKFHIIVFLIDAIFTFYMFFGRQIKFTDCSFFLETHENCVDTNTYYLIVITCFHHTLDSTCFFYWLDILFFACYDYFMSFSVFFEDSRN